MPWTDQVTAIAPYERTHIWVAIWYKNPGHREIDETIAGERERVQSKENRMYGEQVVLARLRLHRLPVQWYSTTIHLSVSLPSIFALRCIYLSFSVLPEHHRLAGMVSRNHLLSLLVHTSWCKFMKRLDFWGPSATICHVPRCKLNWT